MSKAVKIAMIFLAALTVFETIFIMYTLPPLTVKSEMSFLDDYQYEKFVFEAQGNINLRDAPYHKKLGWLNEAILIGTIRKGEDIIIKDIHVLRILNMVYARIERVSKDRNDERVSSSGWIFWGDNYLKAIKQRSLGN